MAKDINDVCVVIQARLGSQRVPKKMLMPFAETTLMDIALDKIKECVEIPLENFYVSAYEDELVAVSKKHGVNVFNRSEASANSEGNPLTEMYEWWNKLDYKYCVLINACAPFLTPKTIDAFMKSYVESPYDGMFGVIEKKTYFWDASGTMITDLPEGSMNTKFVEPVYEAAHCLYAGAMDLIGKGIWMGDFTKNNPALFSMAEREVMDIDYPWQFEVCENLYKREGCETK